MAEARIAPRPKRGFIVNDDFNEADHPRDGGKFTSGGGSETKSGPTTYTSAGASTKELAGEHVDTDEDITATGHDGKTYTYDLAYHHDGSSVAGHVHNVRNEDGTDGFEGLDRVQAYKLGKSLSADAAPHVDSYAAEQTEQSRQDHMTPEEHEAEAAVHQAAAAKAEAAKKDSIGGAVESMLARGWTPEQGKFHQQPELKGYASPSSQRQIKEILRSKGHAADEAPEMAADRAIAGAKREPRLALDRATVRRYDKQSGHLHVSTTPISLSTVNPYRGDEIPEWEDLGLNPDRIYKLYRDPAELEKGAETFNGKPLMIVHKASHATDHPYAVTVGSINNAVWKPPYLMAGLDIWTKEAIDGIESGDRQELSCGYGYKPVMKSGVSPDGQKYDGVMTAIHGNHVSLVPEGRAGSTVYVHDEALLRGPVPKLKDIFSMSRNTAVPSRTAASAQGAFTGGLASGIIVALRPKMATDAKLDVLPMLKGITAKNVKVKSPALVRALDAALKGKLAKDADLDADEVKDIVEQVAEVMSENSEAIAAELSPDVDATTDEEDSDLRAMLKAKGFSDEEVDRICAMEPGKMDPVSASAEDEEGKKAEVKQAVESAIRSLRAEMVTKTAQDAAISAAVEGAVSSERQRNKDIREAEAHIAASPVGKLAGAFDSAPDVFRAGLSALGVKDADKLHDSALRAVFDAHAGLKAAQTKTPVAALASDSATSGKSFSEMFPGSARFTG